MSKIGPHQTTVLVDMGTCPACKKTVNASVTASVSVTATGAKPTQEDSTVVRLSYDSVKVEYARIDHDCGPQEAPMEVAR